MLLIGPRPEQPEREIKLEIAIPHYREPRNLGILRGASP